MRRKKGQLYTSLRNGCTFTAFLALGLLIAAKLEIGNTQHFDGPFFVVDGDTLRQHDERLRLDGIDAPEISQICTRNDEAWPCGEQARIALRELVSVKGFACKGSETDRYRRLLVQCSAGDVDTGARMVENGLAVSASDMYRAEEQTARQRAAGLWAGQFDMPRDWRRTHDADAAAGQGIFATLLEFIGWLKWP